MKVWREAITNAAADCAVAANATLQGMEIIRFDEEENPTGYAPPIIDPIVLHPKFAVPLVARIPITDGETSYELIPFNEDDASAGWIYFNLGAAARELPPPEFFVTQNWITISMAAEGRYAVDFDAAAMANGCSPLVPFTDPEGGQPASGPTSHHHAEGLP